MNKKSIFYAASLVIIAILIFGISSVYAQGPNRGNGNSTGTPTTDDCSGMMQGFGKHRGWGMMGSQGSQDCGQWGWMMGGGMMRHGRGMFSGGMGMGMNGADMDFAAILPPASAEKPSQAVVDLMIAGWTNEQQAYATYQAAVAKFGQVFPFIGVQYAAEQRIAVWEFLFQRYGITLPEKPTATALDATTLAQACKTAAEAEVANDQLYDKMLTNFAAYPDLTFVATMLRNVSQFRLLPVFQSCAG